MLDEDDFIPDVEALLPGLRTELYEHFKSVFTHLQGIDKKFKIAAVICGGPTYSDNGKVKIPINPDDKGAIFHEVGHNLFAKSVFHHAGENDKWGEAFAEAIRWLMEGQRLPSSEWLKDFIKKKTEPGTHKYRAEEILAKSQHTLPGFKALWIRLVSNFKNQSDYLDNELA